MNESKKKPSLLLSLFPLALLVGTLFIGVGMLGLRAEPILVFCTFVAGGIALFLGYNWKDMQEAIVGKISRAMPATLVLWSVGFLIGSWMFSGTIPMLVYYGINIIDPRYLFVSAFLITAIVSTVTGTSWGSAGTVGVAIMGIAFAIGANPAIAAGAIVSGAFFGDKLSPLSDTTNLAPISAGSELYEHIRHMLYTTIPAAVVALVLYYFLGRGATGSADAKEVIELQLIIKDNFNLNIILLIPVLLVLAGSIFKLPAIPVMLGTSLISVLIGIYVQGFELADGFTSLVGGFNLDFAGIDIDEVKSGLASKGFDTETVDYIVWQAERLINRGGVSSVTGTTVLIWCAMGFAGIMTVTGMLDVILHSMLKFVKGVTGLIGCTIGTCALVAFVTGSSYLSIIIPGDLYRNIFIKKKLHPKNLSRTLEDSGTVLVPLIPWSAAGAYMAVTLGVEVLDYLPYAFLNYFGIIFAVILAVTGIGIAKLSDEEQLEYAKANDFDLNEI